MSSSRPDSPPDRESMPYRPCAGVALFNRDGKVLIGRRVDYPADSEHAWQMPQGGIDKGEEPIDAAIRELYEETNVASISLLTAAPEPVRYDLPDEALGSALKGRYRGQEQHWFAALFEGEDSEIDIASPGGGAHHAEFADWRWEDLENLPELVVPFKKDVYLKLVGFFRDIPTKLQQLDAVGDWEADDSLPQ